MTVTPALRDIAARQLARPGTHLTTMMDRFGFTRTEVLEFADHEGYTLDEAERFIRKHPSLAVVANNTNPADTGRIVHPVLAAAAASDARVVTQVIPEYNEPEPSTIDQAINTAAAIGFGIGASGQPETDKLATFDRVSNQLVSVLRPGVVDLFTEARDSDNPHILNLLEQAEHALDILNAAVLRERQVGPLRQRRQELLIELAKINAELFGGPDDKPAPEPAPDADSEVDEPTAGSVEQRIDKEFVRTVPGDPGYFRAVREWAQFYDIEVSTHGRVNQAAIDAYEAWWTE